MKKAFLLPIIAVGLISCGDTGREVEATDAQEVEVTKTETTTTFAAVKDGSYTDWRAAHFGGAEPRYGKVFIKDAAVMVTDGQITNAIVNLDMGSLTVENFGDDAEISRKLTSHLKNEDFFNIEAYPTSTFELTGIEAAQGDYNSTVTGNLTIMNRTKSITFNANVDVYEEGVSIQSEDFAVDRTDWGLTYNVEGTEDVPMDYIIANDIGFTINVKVMKS